MQPYNQQVVAPVRRLLGNRSVRLPVCGAWHLRDEGEVRVHRLELEAACLAENLTSSNRANAPFLLLCFAWWLHRIDGRPGRCEVAVKGDPPSEAAALRHWRRS